MHLFVYYHFIVINLNSTSLTLLETMTACDLLLTGVDFILNTDYFKME